jgi:hypothetical protein
LEFDIAFLTGSVQEEAKPISSAVQVLNEGFPVVQALMIGILYSLPLLLFFIFKRKTAAEDGDSAADRFSHVAALLLILYLGLTVLSLILDAARDIPAWFNSKDLFNQYIGYPGQGATWLIIVFSIMIWPNIVRSWAKTTGSTPDRQKTDLVNTPKRSWIIALAAITIILGLISVLLSIAGNGPQSLIRAYGDWDSFGGVSFSTAFLIIFAASYFAILWFLYELFGRFAWLQTLKILVMVVILATISRFFYEFQLQTILTLVLALPFISSCITLGYYLATSRSLEADKREWSKVGRAAFLISIIGLLVFLLNSNNGNTYPGMLSNLAFTVGRLGIFVLLFVWLQILRDHSRSNDSWILPKDILNIGGVIALSFLFLPTQQWLFILIVFLTALVLLKHWAYVSLRNKKIATLRRRDTVGSVIREQIAINECERWNRTMKKELFGKVGKDNTGFEDYESKIKSIEETIKKKKQIIAGKSLTYSDLMMLGAEASPWERGKNGAYFGLLFSLPWILLFLLNFQKTTLPNVNFEILSVLTTAVLALIQWPLQGFLFGYFYPHIRGGDGMRKGFNFFLLLFIPTFAATVIAQPATNGVWTTHLLWSLQLFIQSMLLGLVAGDYQTLRRAGMNWRHLTEVHNLSALTVWGSSILVAVSAAITTLITSGASSLIANGISALLPDLIPNLPKQR